MLITKKAYKKKYVIGGAGIFDSIGNFFTKMFRVTQQNKYHRQLFTQTNCSKDIGMKDIDVRKTVAIDAGKKFVEKAAKKLSTSKSQVANIIVPPEEITKKINEVIAKYVDTSAINLNKLTHGSIINRPTASNAIVIQDLVNG